MQILEKAWQNWINDNFARGCTYEAMLADMLKAGIAQDVAVFNLSNRQDSAGSTNEGVSNQQSGSYEQEASYLFQHDNTIVTQDGQYIQVAMRLTAPDVVLLDNFMTHDECDAFCELSKSTLTKSTVVDDVTGGHVGHEHRTSLGTYFTLGQNELVKKIEARIAEITGTSAPNGEGFKF